MGSWKSRAYHGPSYPRDCLCLGTCLGSYFAKPWYQGDGLPDCAPGKCPRTAEISPIQCSSDPAMYFNNGYPTNCVEGEACDEAAAAAAEGNPCRPVAGEEGYERK